MLEAETRYHSIDKADALIELEEKLAASMEQVAEASTETMNERACRIDIERRIVDLKAENGQGQAGNSSQRGSPCQRSEHC